MDKEQAFGLVSFLSNIDGVGSCVLLALIAMSVASWYLIGIKSYSGRHARAHSHRYLKAFHSAESVDAISARFSGERPADPYARTVAQGFEALRHVRRVDGTGIGASVDPAEFLTRAIRRAIARESTALESGLTVLASVGSTAPFIGLFGTVWGIYHALIAIGSGGSAGLDAVAGPVGEALIMTAAGLAVAIPAVLAYNFFVRGNRVTIAELDGFAHDLHALLLSGVRRDGIIGRNPDSTSVAAGSGSVNERAA